MDEAGWSKISDVMEILSMTRNQLDMAVERNDKGRLQVRDERIRACQGHSFDGAPVTWDGLEASWIEFQLDQSLWHGTRFASTAGIAERGIERGKRTHVHLAPHPESRVGKRSTSDLLLEVSSIRIREHGLRIFQSQNGVILVRSVPRICIIGLRATHGLTSGALEDARRVLDVGES